MSKLRAAISFKHRVDEVKTIQQQKLRENIAGPILNIDDSNLEIQENPTNLENQQETNIQDDEIGRASCRERSVDLGGRRIIKKKKNKDHLQRYKNNHRKLRAL